MTTSISTPIHITGLSSGMDTDSMVSELMTAASEPLTLLQNQSDDDTAKQSVINTLNSDLSTLQTTVEEFTDPVMPFFAQTTATSMNTSVASAEVSGARPMTGSYSITVNQLANNALVQSQQALYTGADATASPAELQSAASINLSGQSVDATQTLNSQSGNLATPLAASGSITINGNTINWDDSMSLNQILGEINNAEIGVTATFDQTSQKFSLTNNESGSTSQTTVSESSGNFWEAMGITPGTVTGKDATTLDPTTTLATADMDRSVTSGTFTINGVVFNVNANTDSLDNVLTRINNSNAGVVALYDANTGQISLQQKNTGASQKIVLGATGDTSNILYALKLSSNNPPTGGTQDTYSGTDASVSLNGGAAQTFSTNSINALIPGVTVDLNSLGSTSLDVSPDVDSMVNTIQTFVTDYNNVMNYLNTKLTEQPVQTPQNATDRIQGSFVTDSNFQDARNDLESIITSVVPGLSSTMNQLAQIGITTSSTNYGENATLNLDTSTLQTALNGNLSGVEALFNTSSTGIMSQLDAKIQSITDPTTGSLTLESNTYGDDVSNLSSQISDMQTRLNSQQQLLETEFTNMESAMQQLQSQGNQLTATLDKLS